MHRQHGTSYITLRKLARQPARLRQGVSAELSPLLDGLHVMPSFPQSLDSRLREIFVRIQPGHVLGCLIGTDLLRNLIPMRTHIGPGIR